MTWRDRAVCAGWDHARDGDPWHQEGRPGNVSRTGADPYAQARTICDGCPVTAECQAEALTLPRRYIAHGGMWGGLTPDELLHLIDVCPGCERHLWRSSAPRPDDHVRHHAHGLCSMCWNRELRGQAPVGADTAPMPTACRWCGRSMVRAGADKPHGHVLHYARGLCRTCHGRAQNDGALDTFASLNPPINIRSTP